MASDSDGMLLGEKNGRPPDIETDLQKSGYFDGAKQVSGPLHAWAQGSLAKRIRHGRAVPENTTRDFQWTTPFPIPGDTYDAKRSWVYCKLKDWGCFNRLQAV